MKGYLHRLAARAANLGTVLHPLVSPMYASPGHAPAFETPQLDDEFLISEKASRLPAAMHTPAAAPREQSSAAERLLPQRPPVAASSIDSPARMIHRENGASPAHPAPLNATSAPGSAHAFPMQTETQSHDYDSHDSQNPARTAVPHVEQDRRLSTASAPQMPQSSFIASARSSRPDPSARSVPPSREPEIQIHIGRIEVTALPGEAPPAPTASARKSLKLDDYLKRGEGRRG